MTRLGIPRTMWREKRKTQLPFIRATIGDTQALVPTKALGQWEPN
jgi:hypothetical protein